MPTPDSTVLGGAGVALDCRGSTDVSSMPSAQLQMLPQLAALRGGLGGVGLGSC